MQMLEVATDAAELRTLLGQLGLEPSKLLAFTDEHMTILLSKGLSTPAMLANACEAAYTEPPPLPYALREALLDKFNPNALPAGTGGSCSTCCIRHQVPGSTWMVLWDGVCKGWQWSERSGEMWRKGQLSARPTSTAPPCVSWTRHTLL